MSEPRVNWTRLGVVAGLSAAALSGPILDLYGRNPEVWVVNRSSPLQMILFAVGLVLLVPLLYLVVSIPVGMVSERAARYVYVGFVALLALAIGFVVSRQMIPSHTKGAAALTLGIAALVTWLALSADRVVVWAVLAVPALLGIFLFWSPTSTLIWASPDVSETAGIGSPHSLIILQLDEIPLASLLDVDGTINDALFPNFARLAERSTWYRNALSDSIATSQSVPSILSGRTGETTGEGSSYDTRPDNIFTMLGDSYEMHVIEWVTELCPPETCPEYAGRAPKDFVSVLEDMGVVYGHLTLPNWGRERLPAIDTAWTGFLDDPETMTVDDIEIPGLPVPSEPDRDDWMTWMQRIINGLSGDSVPTLSFVHLGTPHVPWNVNPSGTQYVKPEEHLEVVGVDADGFWATSGHDNVVGLQRHLFELGAFDLMLGQMIDHLDQVGAWEDVMLVLVGDHGASFELGQHRRWPYEDNRDDLYRIPLFIKYPGQETGSVNDLPVFGIDIVPTIVEVLEIDTDWMFEGTSLLGLESTREHRPRRWCCNGTGVSTDLEVLLGQVERGYTIIPDRESWTGVVAADSGFGDVLGESVPVGSITELPGFTWSMDLGPSQSSVDWDAGLVQTLVKGPLSIDGPYEGTSLAIAVNGVLAGVAWVSPSGDGFYGVLDENLVPDGELDLDLLIPDGSGGWLSGQRSD